MVCPVIFPLQLPIQLLLAALLVSPGIPAGTVLPITLGTTLDAKKDKPGQKLDGRLMEEVALSGGARFKRGARVSGHVVEVTRLPGGGSRLVLKFDQIEGDGQNSPLNVSVRAIADSQSVYHAHIPIDASSNYESENMWVVRQVGGDIVNRGRRIVASGDAIVGRWDGTVWAKLAYVPGCPPRDLPKDEQPMWVFSVNACGVYGEPDIKLTSAGNAEPAGQIVLESPKDAKLGGGSGWLLVSNGAATSVQ